jgi:transposase-like protein
MRYPASEKAEIIGLVEQSHLPARRTLDKLGIPRATFYRWYDRYREGGPEALAVLQAAFAVDAVVTSARNLAPFHLIP